MINPSFKNSNVYDYQHLMYNSNKQGVQGYYFSKIHSKYYWIRSTFEYITIEYYENNNIPYDYEYKTYLLDDNRQYRPDFHLFTDFKFNKIKEIIEIKSNYYISHQDGKLYQLIKQVNCPCKIIIGLDNLLEYIGEEKNFYYKKLKEWKKKRLCKEDLENKLLIG